MVIKITTGVGVGVVCMNATSIKDSMCVRKEHNTIYSARTVDTAYIYLCIREHDRNVLVSVQPRVLECGAPSDGYPNQEA